MSKWKGTPVPNSGTLGEVYINTALSVEEVNTELNKIESWSLRETSDLLKANIYQNMAIVAANNDYSKMIALLLLKYVSSETNELLGYVIVTMVQTSTPKQEIIFTGYSIDENASLGWVENISNPYNFEGLNLLAEFPGANVTFFIGTDNDKLSSLISTTPFELVEDEPVEEDPIDDVLKPFLKEVADAIRYVEGSSEDINAQDFNERIIALGNGSGGIPEEITTAEEMTALLVERNVGKVYKFTGVTDENFTNGCYYLVEEVAE